MEDEHKSTQSPGTRSPGTPPSCSPTQAPGTCLRCPRRVQLVCRVRWRSTVRHRPTRARCTSPQRVSDGLGGCKPQGKVFLRLFVVEPLCVHVHARLTLQKQALPSSKGYRHVTWSDVMFIFLVYLRWVHKTRPLTLTAVTGFRSFMQFEIVFLGNVQRLRENCKLRVYL